MIRAGKNTHTHTHTPALVYTHVRYIQQSDCRTLFYDEDSQSVISDDIPPDIPYLELIINMTDFPCSMAPFFLEFFTGPFGAMHMSHECVDLFKVLILQRNVNYPADLLNISDEIFRELGFSNEYTNQIREMVSYKPGRPTSDSAFFSLSHVANTGSPFIFKPATPNMETERATTPPGGVTVTPVVFPTRNAYLNSVVNMPGFPMAMVSFFLLLFGTTNADDRIACVLIDKFEALVMQLKIQTPSAFLDVREMEFRRIRISQYDTNRARAMVNRVLRPDSDDQCSVRVNIQANSCDAREPDYMRQEDDTDSRSPYAYSLLTPSISMKQWNDIAHVRFGLFEGSLKSITDLFFSFKGGEIVLDCDTQTCMWVCRLCGVVSGSLVCMNSSPPECLWMDPNVLVHHGRSMFHTDAMQLMNNLCNADSRIFASAPWFACSAETYYRDYLNGELAARRRGFVAPIPQKDVFVSRGQLLSAYGESATISSTCCQDIIG
jgi:hypothetical protein